jgi:hypothetical protein
MSLTLFHVSLRCIPVLGPASFSSDPRSLCFTLSLRASRCLHTGASHHSYKHPGMRSTVERFRLELASLGFRTSTICMYKGEAPRTWLVCFHFHLSLLPLSALFSPFPHTSLSLLTLVTFCLKTVSQLSFTIQYFHSFLLIDST